MHGHNMALNHMMGFADVIYVLGHTVYQEIQAIGCDEFGYVTCTLCTNYMRIGYIWLGRANKWWIGLCWQI